MRCTIITDQAGNLVGSVKGDVLSEKQGDVEATLVAGPGQRLHHIDVDSKSHKCKRAAPEIGTAFIQATQEITFKWEPPVAPIFC